MAYVIGEPCVNVKDTACVDVCPVDCIHAKEGSNQYYIDPVTCIDCSACEPACPVDAIWPLDQLPENQKRFIAINADFFKGFDKSLSTAYTRKKKEDGKEETGAPSPTTGSSTTTAEAASLTTEWKETENWEKEWELHKNDIDDRTEIQKRYGRVRAVLEEPDKYILRFFLPERTPNHPYKYRYGLPAEMGPYEISAEAADGMIRVWGKLADPGLAKLCGLANSFPDRFFVELPVRHRIETISIMKVGKHVTDVVALKAADKVAA